MERQFMETSDRWSFRTRSMFVRMIFKVLPEMVKSIAMVPIPIVTVVESSLNETGHDGSNV